jgi:hypothetical protein
MLHNLRSSFNRFTWILIPTAALVTVSATILADAILLTYGFLSVRYCLSVPINRSDQDTSHMWKDLS